MFSRHVKSFLSGSSWLVQASLILTFHPHPPVLSYATSQLQAIVQIPTQVEIGETPDDIIIFEDAPDNPILAAGDINGDGIDDLVHTYKRPPVSLPASLKAGVIFGKRDINSPSTINLAAAQPDLAITAESLQSGTRIAFGSRKDINGDNIDELSWGINGTQVPGGQQADATFIMFGSQNLRPGMMDLAQLQPDLVILDRPNGLARLIDLADVNGDGAKDLIFSVVPLRGSQISYSIFFGPIASGTTIDLQTQQPDVFITGASELRQFDRMIDIADVSGDGIDDIILGRPGRSPNDRIEAGEVDIFLGSPSLASGTVIDLSRAQPDVRILGAVGGMDFSFGDALGRAIETGDINGDGIDDILLGVVIHYGIEPGTQTGFPGEVYVIFGSDSLKGRVIDILHKQHDLTIRGADGNPAIFKFGDALGSSTTCWDINGDQIEDILVSAPAADGLKNKFEDSGEAYVILGSRMLERGTTIEVGRNQQDVIIFAGNREERVTGIGFATGKFDFNGDGISEIVIRGKLKDDSQPGQPARNVTLIYFGGQMRAPEITKVKFSKDSSELLIFGMNFNGATQVEVNGMLLDREARFILHKNRLVVEGGKKALNLKSGRNQITVIRKGARSNTFTLRI